MRLFRFRGGFTLIEVMLAAMILTMLPIGAMMLTHRLCGFAKDEMEKIVASSYCSDVYMRLVRMNSSEFTNFVNSVTSWTYKMPKDTLPHITDENGNQECILMRNGWANVEPELTVRCLRDGLVTSSAYERSLSSLKDLYHFEIMVKWKKYNGDSDYRRCFAITNVVSLSVDNNGLK